MCISIFDMCAANQAGEARHDSVGLVGGSLRHYRSVAGIRDQCGRASTIKLSRGDRALVRMARFPAKWYAATLEIGREFP